MASIEFINNSSIGDDFPVNVSELIYCNISQYALQTTTTTTNLV